MVETVESLLRDLFLRSSLAAWPFTNLETIWLAVAILSFIILMLTTRPWRLVWKSGESTSGRLGRELLGLKITGYAAIVVFFGGLGGLATIAALASAAIAPGLVSPDGHRKTVEHLEGGIVREIVVREGDHVDAGQVLIELEDVKAKAEYEELRERFVHLVSAEARLRAELEDSPSVEAPKEFADFDSASYRPALNAQRRLFEIRQVTLQSEEQILGQRVLQLEAEIDGLHEVIEAENEKLELIGQEIENVDTLYKKGLSQLPKLLALKRARADIRAARASNRARIARHKQSIGETRLQLLHMRKQRSEQAAQELSGVRTELAVVRSQLPSRRDVLTRTVVTAPVAGTVMNVQVTTASGVIGSGEPLLEIVPDGARLVIDAHVNPTDMDTVHAGQAARVLFTAYGQRSLPQIFGTLRSISADHLLDERTGEPYFLAKVDIDPAELKKIESDVKLAPGMPADVMILTGERTLLDYLLRPFVESITKSFRES